MSNDRATCSAVSVRQLRWHPLTPRHCICTSAYSPHLWLGPTIKWDRESTCSGRKWEEASSGGGGRGRSVRELARRRTSGCQVRVIASRHNGMALHVIPCKAHDNEGKRGWVCDQSNAQLLRARAAGKWGRHSLQLKRPPSSPHGQKGREPAGCGLRSKGHSRPACASIPCMPTLRCQYQDIQDVVEWNEAKSRGGQRRARSCRPPPWDSTGLVGVGRGTLPLVPATPS